MKRRKKSNIRRTSKRNRHPATRASLRNGTKSCGLGECLQKAIQPVLKALGWK